MSTIEGLYHVTGFDDWGERLFVRPVIRVPMTGFGTKRTSRHVRYVVAIG